MKFDIIKKGVPPMKNLYFLLLTLVFTVPTFAEDAKTLPQGRLRARLRPIFAFDMTEKYDAEKNKVSLVNKFEKQLDTATVQKLSPKLAGAMQAFGVSNLGTFDPALDVESLAIGSA